MCDYKLWYESEENVYVLQCLTCNNFQLRFFNTALMFDYYEYHLFCNIIFGHYSSIENNTAGHSFVIPAFDDGVELQLSRANLIKLYFLLDYTDTEMCAAGLSGLFGR